ncbi:MAG: heparinase II/III family protein [Gammaproteobacteria bacterium]|nr:heparinase II/III family protein [Gammaproteobacteria bacterium]
MVVTIALGALLGSVLRDSLVAPAPVRRVDTALALAPKQGAPATFHAAHPRLPMPTPADLEVIARDNPGWLAAQQRRATATPPDVQAAILLAAAGRDALPLDELHRLLLAQPYGFRGNDVWLLAQGYDWLHARWSPAQRETLGRYLLAGCDAVIAVLRDQLLSPYNVYLYNRPLQSLTACAIALYRDLPEATPVMNFAYGYWREFVLPVWRQVMGTQGGWHEGGEYVGIGIGQAMYTVPALWRLATGDDAFDSVPGLAGMLDFLVYRTRPDGTQIRWGDAGHFRRDAPDRVPLAIEYRHAAAYSLGGCPRQPAPTAEPWGPLPRDELCDPQARERLPLARLFDGIGLLIARNSWRDDATLVTFRAGDNYWSHTHLDQGAFTIDQRGPLAIDSGLYGTSYGSDHHLNYTYQTIAHNTIVVYDPADTVPASHGDTTRAIANDGGQRRVGSGWGTGPAPLSRDQWLERRETFHTATLLDAHIGDALSLVSADLTPAYTNALSGKGTFAARTRRVERFVRTFGYDAAQDIVVVHDRLRLSRPDLEPKWLLHSVRAPEIEGNTFRVPGSAGVELHGTVLLPQRARLTRVGGPGSEYLVDGQDYDDDGKVAALAAQRPDAEPGAWRLEVTPEVAGDRVEYLVVLAPVATGSAALVLEPTAAASAYRIGRGADVRTWRFDQQRVTVSSPTDPRRSATVSAESPK